MTTGVVARVLLDSPLPQLDRLFDYRVPEALHERAVPGVRVVVPLRSAGRQAKGFIVEIVNDGEFDGVLSEIDDVVSAAPVLHPDVYRLIRRAADRAAGTASDLARLAVPPRQVRVEKSWLASERVDAPLPQSLAIDGYSAADLAGVLASDQPELANLAPLGGAARRVALTAIPEPTRLASGEWVPSAQRTLAQLAAAMLATGRSAIISVPDYRDLDHVAECLDELVAPEHVSRVDASQPPAARYRAFLRTLDDAPVIVIGNRSALLAPASRLGLIVLWDDGDDLHVEPHAPGVHSRDLALLRQEDSGCALVLAAHARSTDAQRLIELGWLSAVEPSPRRRRRITPTAHRVNDEGPASQARIPSTAWRVVSDALASGPVLVQVARPGFAPRVACTECGETARCLRCRGPLAVPRAGSTPTCRWCGSLAVGWACATCEGTRWRSAGRGSARTADELGRAFPGARVIVSDGATPVQRAPGGRTLVVATRGAEPLVPGGYSAVLLLDGESMLARESLRVVEDCVRWWCNAAALAAPDAPVLLVGVSGPVATALATGRPELIAASELADRRALRFPPAVRVAALVGTREAVERASKSLEGLDGVDTLGPVALDEGKVRTIVRLDVARGGEVASRLKAELVRGATAKAPAIPGRPPRRRVPALRVRFDDAEPFDDHSASRASG